MKIKDFFNKVVSKVEDTMFPHYVCPFCKTETPDGCVCNDCLKLAIQPTYCAKCSEHITEGSTICIECKDYERIFDKNISVFNYTDKVSLAIQRFKFKQEKYLAKDFAILLAQKYAQANISADIITFVPASKKRVKERGYNQAEELANELSKLINIPTLNLLIKTKETVHQTQLSRKERLQNLMGSIAVADKWQIKGKNILVIDDVFTTGSTMSTCAKVLKKAGATNVYGLTLAKTAIKN